jgi:hypothetical protein
MRWACVTVSRPIAEVRRTADLVFHRAKVAVFVMDAFGMVALSTTQRRLLEK